MPPTARAFIACKRISPGGAVHVVSSRCRNSAEFEDGIDVIEVVDTPNLAVVLGLTQAARRPYHSLPRQVWAQ